MFFIRVCEQSDLHFGRVSFILCIWTVLSVLPGAYEGEGAFKYTIIIRLVISKPKVRRRALLLLGT